MRTQTETVNGYTFNTGDVSSVGNWDGEEEAACAAIDAIKRRIAELLPEGGEDDGRFHQACSIAWDRLGTSDRLPDLSDKEIDAAARSLV